MARTGPAPKNKEDRVRGGTPITALLPDVVADAATALAVRVPPVPPSGLRTLARRAWFAYFKSDVSAAFDEDADLHLLRRWVTYLDEWYRVSAVLRKEDRIVTGSQGQPVLNSLITYLEKLEKSIGRAEKELGLTPLSRAHLGLTAAEGTLTVQRINARILEAVALETSGDADVIDIEEAEFS